MGIGKGEVRGRVERKREVVKQRAHAHRYTHVC